MALMVGFVMVMTVCATLYFSIYHSVIYACNFLAANFSTVGYRIPSTVLRQSGTLLTLEVKTTTTLVYRASRGDSNRTQTY